MNNINVFSEISKLFNIDESIFDSLKNLHNDELLNNNIVSKMIKTAIFSYVENFALPFYISSNLDNFSEYLRDLFKNNINNYMQYKSDLEVENDDQKSSKCIFEYCEFLCDLPHFIEETSELDDLIELFNKNAIYENSFIKKRRFIQSQIDKRVERSNETKKYIQKLIDCYNEFANTNNISINISNQYFLENSNSEKDESFKIVKRKKLKKSEVVNVECILMSEDSKIEISKI